MQDRRGGGHHGIHFTSLCLHSYCYAQTCPLGFTINLTTNKAKNNMRVSVHLCLCVAQAQCRVCSVTHSSITLKIHLGTQSHLLKVHKRNLIHLAQHYFLHKQVPCMPPSRHRFFLCTHIFWLFVFPFVILRHPNFIFGLTFRIFCLQI